MLTQGRKLDWRWLRDGAVTSFAFSLFLGFLGPFGDYGTVPAGQRVAAWVILGMTGFGIYAAVLYLLDRYGASLIWILRQAGAALIGTVFLTPVVAAVDSMITGDAASPWLAMYATILPIGVAYLALFEALRVARRNTRAVAASAAPEAESPPSPPRFMRRLPKDVSGALICLAKEDHYLRVYTENGNSLIRLRMSDAVAELDSTPGLQTHRSWWLADDAVVSARRRPGGGGEATLSNGLTAPIARARLSEAQAAGWFDR